MAILGRERSTGQPDKTNRRELLRRLMDPKRGQDRHPTPAGVPVPTYVDLPTTGIGSDAGRRNFDAQVGTLRVPQEDPRPQAAATEDTGSDGSILTAQFTRRAGLITAGAVGLGLAAEKIAEKVGVSDATTATWQDAQNNRDSLGNPDNYNEDNLRYPPALVFNIDPSEKITTPQALRNRYMERLNPHDRGVQGLLALEMDVTAALTGSTEERFAPNRELQEHYRNMLSLMYFMPQYGDILQFDAYRNNGSEQERAATRDATINLLYAVRALNDSHPGPNSWQQGPNGITFTYQGRQIVIPI